MSPWRGKYNMDYDRMARHFDQSLARELFIFSRVLDSIYECISSPRPPWLYACGTVNLPTIRGPEAVAWPGEHGLGSGDASLSELRVISGVLT